MSEDYYALLGVDPEASEEAILQAYREKAAEHHPDVSEAADAEATFQQLNEAKDVLTDAKRRREYDRVGHDQYVADSREGRAAGHATARSQSRGDRPASSSAWPTGFGSILEEFLSGPATWTPTAGSRPTRSPAAGGRDPFVIDLEARIRGQEAAGQADRGGGRSRQGDGSHQERTECPRCKGRGQFVHEIDTIRGRSRRLEPCDRCGGSGTLSGPE